MYAIIDKRKRKVYEKDGKFYIYKRVKKLVNKSDIVRSSSPKKPSYIEKLKRDLVEKEERFSNLKSEYEAKYKDVLKSAQYTVKDPKQRETIEKQQQTLQDQKRKLEECNELKSVIENLRTEVLTAQKEISVKEQALKNQATYYDTNNRLKDTEYEKLVDKYKKISDELGLKDVEIGTLKTDIERFKQECSVSLKQDKEKFTKMLMTDKSDSELLKEQLTQAILDYKKANTDLENLRARFAQQEEDISQMDAQIAKFIREKNVGLSYASAEYLKEAEILRKRISDLESSLKYSQEQAENYRNTATLVIKDMREISKKYNECETDKNELKQQVVNVGTSLLRASTDLSRKLEEIDMLSEMLEEERTHSKLCESRREDERLDLASYQFLKEQLEVKFGDTMNKLAACTTEKAELQSKFGDSMNDLSACSIEKAELQSKFGDAMNELAECKLSRIGMDKTRIQLQEDFDEAMRRLAELENQEAGHEDMTERFGDNMNKLADCTLRAQRLQIEFQDKSDDLEFCNQDKQETIELYQNIYQRYTDAAAQNSILTQRNQELTDTILGMQVDLEQMRGNVTNENICTDIKQQFEKYKATTAENMSSYQKQISDLKSSLENANSAITTLQLDLASKEAGTDIEKIREEYEETIKNIQLDVQTLADQYESKTAQTEQMQERYMSQIHELQDQVRSLVTNVSQLETQNNQLEDQLFAAGDIEPIPCEPCKEVDEEEMRRLVTRNQVLSSRVLELEGSVREMEKIIDETNQTYSYNNRILRARITELEEENEVRKKDDEECDRLSERSGQSDRLERRVEELALDNDVLRKENEGLREMLGCVVENDTCQQRMGECMQRFTGEVFE